MRYLHSGFVGESAAILASCCWTISSILFTLAGKRSGPLSVNAYRTLMAVGLMVCAHMVLIGELLPVASSEQWFWMGLSGIVGVGIGDSAVFATYIAIGPKRSLLLQLSSPIFASAGAYLMLGETFSLLSILGIAITLTGIIVVLLESGVKPEEKQLEKKRKTWAAFEESSSTVIYSGKSFFRIYSRSSVYPSGLRSVWNIAGVRVAR